MVYRLYNWIKKILTITYYYSLIELKNLSLKEKNLFFSVLLIIQITILYFIVIFNSNYFYSPNKVHTNYNYYNNNTNEDLNTNKYIYQPNKIKLIIFCLFISLALVSGYILLKQKSTKDIYFNENKQIESLVSHLSKLFFSHDLRKPFNLIKILINNINKENKTTIETTELNHIISK